MEIEAQTPNLKYLEYIIEELAKNDLLDCLEEIEIKTPVKLKKDQQTYTYILSVKIEQVKTYELPK